MTNGADGSSRKKEETVRQVARLSHRAEAQWDVPDERRRRLDELAQLLAPLKDDPDQDLRHLGRLEPLVRQDLTLAELFAVTTPAERLVDTLAATPRPSVETTDATAPVAEPFALTVILDNIRSAHNVGAIFRTAECLGIRELVLCGYTPTPENPKVLKASMGTENNVPWRWLPRARDAIGELRGEGATVYALETAEAAQSASKIRVLPPAGLVVGNEHFGVMPEVLKEVDQLVRIPVFGRKNSLNVASAFAVCGFYFRT